MPNKTSNPADIGFSPHDCFPTCSLCVNVVMLDPRHKFVHEVQGCGCFCTLVRVRFMGICWLRYLMHVCTAENGEGVEGIVPLRGGASLKRMEGLDDGEV